MPDLVTPSGNHRLGLCQQLQRLVEVALGTYLVEDPSHGFDVVVECVGPLGHHGAQSVPVTLEVGYQDLDPASREPLSDLADALREDEGPAVGKVIAVYRSDDRVLKAHHLNGLGQTHRLLEVERRGPAGLDGTVGAGARADVAEDHEGGGPSVPALADVGAVGLFAYGV